MGREPNIRGRYKCRLITWAKRSRLCLILCRFITYSKSRVCLTPELQKHLLYTIYNIFKSQTHKPNINYINPIRSKYSATQSQISWYRRANNRSNSSIKTFKIKESIKARKPNTKMTRGLRWPSLNLKANEHLFKVVWLWERGSWTWTPFEGHAWLSKRENEWEKLGFWHFKERDCFVFF